MTSNQSSSYSGTGHSSVVEFLQHLDQAIERKVQNIIDEIEQAYQAKGGHHSKRTQPEN